MKNKLILGIITLVCGLAVSGFYYLLNDRITDTKKEKELSIKKLFFPTATAFEELSNGLILAKSDTQEELGFLFHTGDPAGYGGKVQFTVALNPDGSIKDFLMTEHNETPGLGTKVNEESFKKGFKGIYPYPEKMPSGKKEFNSKLGIDAISGATISSMAAVRALSKYAHQYTTWCMERKMKKIEQSYQQVNPNTYQNFNVTVKKQPVQQPVTRPSGNIINQPVNQPANNINQGQK